MIGLRIQVKTLLLMGIDFSVLALFIDPDFMFICLVPHSFRYISFENLIPSGGKNTRDILKKM